VQIVDQLNRPMFDLGSARLKPHAREILLGLSAPLNEVKNSLSLTGHTDAKPYVSGERGYSNWELSSDRANASRRELVAGGLPDDRVLRVQGLASSNPIEPADPASPANRRISIIVMNRDAEDRFFRNTPEVEPEPAAAASTSSEPAR
jgi:chemotaxis protein MotB